MNAVETKIFRKFACVLASLCIFNVIIFRVDWPKCVYE
jgi:hypothetical protein